MHSTVGDPDHGRITETREPGHFGKFVNTRSDRGLHHVLKYENMRMPCTPSNISIRGCSPG